MESSIKNTFNLVNYLIRSVPKFIQKVRINTKSNNITLYTNNNMLLDLLNFLKNN